MKSPVPSIWQLAADSPSLATGLLKLTPRSTVVETFAVIEVTVGPTESSNTARGVTVPPETNPGFEIGQRLSVVLGSPVQLSQRTNFQWPTGVAAGVAASTNVLLAGKLVHPPSGKQISVMSLAIDWLGHADTSRSSRFDVLSQVA